MEAISLCCMCCCLSRRRLARRGEQEWLCCHLKLHSGFAFRYHHGWARHGLHANCIGQPISAGCQLERSFILIHFCFAAEDKEKKYFPVRCYCSVVVLQKRDYHSDTSKPLLKVLGNKCNPRRWKVNIFPFIITYWPTMNIYKFLFCLDWIVSIYLAIFFSELCQILHLCRKTC